jgi:orotate phosphoribosyltransferase
MTTAFIEFLARNNAIRFGEFALKSGRLSPYFIDVGILSTGSTIAELGRYYASKIHESFGTNFDVVFGPAYKGIPLAISAAVALHTHHSIEKRWLYDRKEMKLHGADANSMFVGSAGLDEGARVVIVDDVFTTGGTKVDAISKLEKSLKAEVIGIVIAVDRLEIGRRRTATVEFAEDTGIPIHPITNTNAIFEHLHSRAVEGRIYVPDKTYKAFQDYMDEYGAKSTIRG